MQVSALLTLTTDLVKDYQIPISVRPVIPSLIPGEDADSSAYKSGDVVYEFSKVQVGGVAFESIDITNPSDHPLEVEIILGVRRPVSEAQSDEDGSYLDGAIAECGMEVQAGGGASFALMADAVVHAILAPREEKLFGPIALRPTKQGVESHASLFLHNNLTLLEEIELIAEGGSGVLGFRDGDAPLKEVRLELNGSYLGFQRVRDGRGWALPPGGKLTWPAVAARTLKAHNSGDVRLEVRSLQVGSGPGCKGSGFSVSSCRGFALEPGEEHELTFFYRPDFKAAMQRQDLRLMTSAGEVSVPLVGRVPKQLLPLCLESVPRSTLPLRAAGTAFSIVALACGAFFGWELYVQRGSEGSKLRKGGGGSHSKNVAGERPLEESRPGPQANGSYSRSSSGGSTGPQMAQVSLPKSGSKPSLQEDNLPQPGTPQNDFADEGWIEAVSSRGQEKQGKKTGGKARKGAEPAKLGDNVGREVEQQTGTGTGTGTGKPQEQKVGGKIPSKGEGGGAKPKKGARSQVAPEPLPESVPEGGQVSIPNCPLNISFPWVRHFSKSAESSFEKRAIFPNAWSSQRA
jgi:hypothetical protein